MNSIISSTMTPAQLKACLPPDQAPAIIATLDAASIKEHGKEALLRQALERIVNDPVSRQTLLREDWSRRAKRMMQILEDNPTYWCYPQSLKPNSRAIRAAREVRDDNNLGKSEQY